MAPGRRWAVRLAAFSAAILLIAEVLAFVAWGPPFSGLFLLALLALLAVPALGALLLARGDERGVAVLVTGGLIAIPMLLFDLVELLRAIDPVTPAEVTVSVLQLVQSATLLVAGALAWVTRMRRQWTWNAPIPWAYAGIALVTFTVGDLWPRRMLVPPRLAIETASLLQVVVLAVVLVAVARLPRALGATVLLTAVGPALAIALFDLAQALSFSAGVREMAGPVYIVGRLLLVAIAVRWLHREREEPRRVPAPRPA